MRASIKTRFRLVRILDEFGFNKKEVGYLLRCPTSEFSYLLSRKLRGTQKRNVLVHSRQICGR